MRCAEKTRRGSLREMMGQEDGSQFISDQDGKAVQLPGQQPEQQSMLPAPTGVGPTGAGPAEVGTGRVAATSLPAAGLSARKIQAKESDGLLHVAWRRRWIVASVMLVCIAAAVLYFFLATPFYASTAELNIERTSPP